MDLLLSFFFIIIITLLFVHVPTSVLAYDDKYDECSAPLQCGNMNISYPFWGEDRSEYCGYPGFKVDCNSDVPQITILERTYRVLKFDRDSKIVSVAIQDYSGNSCPTKIGNSPLNLTIFNYSSNTQNISLYYGCPKPSENEQLQLLLVYQFSCSAGETTNTDTVNYFFTNNDIVSAHRAYLETCTGRNVQVAVFGSTVEYINRDPVSANVNQFLRYGFGLQWKANNDMCVRCERSKGVCGYDSDTSEFTCYCPDQPYPYTCPYSKGNGKLPKGAVAGISAGSAAAGIIVVFLLLFIIRKRRKIAAQTKTRDLQTLPTKLGDGGFGVVYHGELKDGRSVAVKRLYENSLKPEVSQQRAVVSYSVKDSISNKLGQTSLEGSVIKQVGPLGSDSHLPKNCEEIVELRGQEVIMRLGVKESGPELFNNEQLSSVEMEVDSGTRTGAKATATGSAQSFVEGKSVETSNRVCPKC
ncbi:hypothetical protein Q3G72_032305 [Acer saccharum]|nr:hypothetical protein Q3G72_032305 [Acer saccharum]